MSYCMSYVAYSLVSYLASSLVDFIASFLATCFANCLLGFLVSVLVNSLESSGFLLRSYGKFIGFLSRNACRHGVNGKRVHEERPQQNQLYNIRSQTMNIDRTEFVER